MPITTPVGTLDFVNARIGAAEIRATSNIGVANVAPTKTFSVGNEFHVSTTDADAVTIRGNVVAQTLKIGDLEIVPKYDIAAVSNVGNATSNTIQFTNITTGFVTSSNVEIGGNITLASNAQVKVGSNVLAEYTGPHGRDPTTPLLKKYPEIVFEEGKFDRNDTTNTYTQAGYTVSSNGYYSNGPTDLRQPWRAFNNDILGGSNATDVWLTPSGSFDNTNSPSLAVNGDSFTVDSTIYTGHWIKLKLPNKIKASKIRIYSRGNDQTKRRPHKGVFLGSNTGNTNDWSVIKTFDGDLSWSVVGVDAANREILIADLNSTTNSYFKYVMFVIQSTIGIGQFCWINEIKYYGYEEPAPPGDLSLDTTLKSTFNSVRSNNYVMYFDGDGFDPNDTNSNNLVTGSSVSVVHHNATYDSTDKYWTLDGSTESNVTTGSLGFEGDVPHTVSMWVNSSNLDANATTQQLFSIGSGYDKALVRVDDTQIAANTWHNVTHAYQGEGGSKVTYVDGRKVEEAQVEDTFGEYPPFAMDDYEVGGYRVSASSELPHSGSNYKAWRGFDDSVTGNDNLWICAAGLYDGTGAYTGSTSTTVSGTAYSGEWLQIELPHKLKVNYVAVLPQNDTLSRAPKNGVFAGSNDGNTWNLLGSFTGITTTSSPAWSATVPVNFTLTSSTAYKYFRIIVTAGVSTSLVTVQNMQIYGHKEGDLTRFPEPTRVLKYPHVAMTGPGQRGYVASASSNFDTYNPWEAFDNNTGGGWISVGGTNYSGGDGAYNKSPGSLLGTISGTSTEIRDGEFLQIETPHKIAVNHILISSGSGDGPTDFKFWGSNDSSAWSLLHTETNHTNGTSAQVNINSSVAYKYHAIVISKTRRTSQGDYVNIRELELYGTQEDTGTPAIVGGPFAGKVANFRVYDQYLGDERIQEIYDAQKDEFGHKKSSMTFYKGRIGVGTTEPEGALTVVDEPHALAKFPARAVSADDSYVEGDGQIKLSAADGSGYQAFDGLTSTSWTATPERHTRLSEEVDFGAWLKMETPESMSLKKAEFESNPNWRQVGSDLIGDVDSNQFGRSNDCSHDGTRIIIGSYTYNNSQGRVKVYDWNGSAWTQVGNTLTGTTTEDEFGRRLAISGDGNIIAVAARAEHTALYTDAGVVRVYHLVGSTWTILPDSGTETETETGYVDTFVGTSTQQYLGGGGVKLSYDGKTLLIGDRGNDTTGLNRGQVRVYTYSDGAWSQKGLALSGTVVSQNFGAGVDMSEDGNHLIIGTGGSASQVVQVYAWDGTVWSQKGSDITYSGGDNFGPPVSISNDGNVIALGIPNADLADGALADDGGIVRMYHYTESYWELNTTLVNEDTGNDDFGDDVQLSGDGNRLIVSAPDDNSNRGKLYTFEYNGTSWKKKEPIINFSATGLNTSDRLGYGAATSDQSLTLSRDGSVIVGGQLGYETGSLNNAGRVRVWNMPSNIKSIWGSNDDVNWTKITTAPTREEATSNVAGLAFGYDDRLEFKNLDNPNYYKYHVIVADAFTRLKDVKLFGVRNQGSSTLHDGTLTLTKNLDVPRIGPPPDADDTPRRDRLVVEYNTHNNPLEDGLVQDTSGRGNDGVFYGGAVYDAAKKAWTNTSLYGTGDYVYTKTNLGSGDFPFAMSFWVKMLSYNGIMTMVALGSDATNKGMAIDIYAGGSFYWFGKDGSHQLWNTAGTNQTSDIFPLNTWVHVAVVHNEGGGAATDDVYINGASVPGTASISNADAINFDDNPDLVIGARWATASSASNDFCPAHFSNFKLYDTALTAHEVKTLYDMGRCSNAIPKTLHIMGGMMRYNNDINRLQIHNGERWSTIGGISATGGTITTVNEYTIHTFTESGTFTIVNGDGGYMDILIVAGGGAGGSVSNAGGGGAGGVRLAQNLFVTRGSYSVVVGGGGSQSGGAGTNGSNSSFPGSTAVGGGGGGEYRLNGSNGGSGGGAGATDLSSANGGSGTQTSSSDYTGYGNDGGGVINGGGLRSGGGGGGAGGPGGQADEDRPGDGGVGIDLSTMFGTNVGESGYFASGGHGQSRSDTTRIYIGPIGGGGANENSRAGLANTGGGGAGGPGGVGGSGVVIIRYL